MSAHNKIILAILVLMTGQVFSQQFYFPNQALLGSASVSSVRDSSGWYRFGNYTKLTNSTSTVAKNFLIDMSGAQPVMNWYASDGDVTSFTVGTSDQMIWSGAGGGYSYSNGGIFLGSATGGNKGAGTINATALYDDNIQLIAPPFDSSHVANGGLTGADIRDAAVGATQLAPTAVTAGSYTNTSLTVDADGRITAAANGAASSTFNPLTTFRFFEDFLGGTTTSGDIGEHGWTLYRQDGTELYGYGTAYNANHPYTFQLSTNNPSTVTLYQGNKALLLDDGYFEVSVEVVSGSNVSLFVGLGDVTTGTQGLDFSDAVGFDYLHNTSTNWRMVTDKDASRTITASSTAVTSGWHRLKFVVNSGRTSIEFFVDGTSIGTLTTNIPSGSADSMFPIFGIRTNGIGYFRLDYFDITSVVSR